jgi:alkanesulfonate monooxygenase SsuD/methylene tetrahydromethanopterin reductase-like flavin-dependent oxidoreductase (luciferase family)
MAARGTKDQIQPNQSGPGSLPRARIRGGIGALPDVGAAQIERSDPVLPPSSTGPERSPFPTPSTRPHDPRSPGGAILPAMHEPTGRPLKVGIQLPEVEWEARWSDLRAMAVRVEELGFDSVWYGDHLLYRLPGEPRARGPWEAWTTLAGIAAVTSRIEIGPLVAATAFHAPAMLAKMAATVDEISGGRLILGLGAGWNETEFAGFGFPFDRRISRFAEAFTIIRALLQEGEIDFAGEFFTARDCELAPRPRPGGPPLMLGSSGPRMLEIGIPHVSAWNAWYDAFGNRPAGIPPLRDAVDAACRAAGRDPASVERTVAVLVRLAGGSGRTMGDTGMAAIPPVSGTPEEIAATLRAFAAEGIAHVQLVVDPITLASLDALASVLELLDRG